MTGGALVLGALDFCVAKPPFDIAWLGWEGMWRHASGLVLAWVHKGCQKPWRCVTMRAEASLAAA